MIPSDAKVFARTTLIKEDHNNALAREHLSEYILTPHRMMIPNGNIGHKQCYDPIWDHNEKEVSYRLFSQL